jgi:uncharacterized membrane protein YfcA
MDFWMLVIIFLVGIIVGFINTIAGSGSLITLPLLIFFGLDANVANGTNRISILLQTLVGILTFRKHKMLELKYAFTLSIPVMAGAIAGTYTATLTPAHSLEKILGFLFILLTVFIFIKPKQWNKHVEDTSNMKFTFFHYVIFILLGFYGGFIQAGVGIFMLFALVSIMGFDVVRANALKLFLTFIYTPISLIIFWNYNQVDWLVGIVLAFGSMLGAYVSATMAVQKGAVFVKWFVIIMIIFSALYFIFYR